MKIDQPIVTRTFQCRNGTSGSYHDLDDVHRIQAALKRELEVTISEAEAIDFWRWRSNEWDASWLSVGDDSEILEFFQKFLKFVGVETDEDEEDYPDANEESPRTGVKVLVRDDENVPWEIELDPDYHAQLIREIESQIPEESTGGSIRYSLEYDPSKVWNMRKLEG